MCLVENAQRERILAYIQSEFARTKPRINCFVHRYCFVFKNEIVSSKSLFEILDKFFECLETRSWKLDSRSSKLDSRASKLNSRFSKTSRIENQVSSRDCQLTFERYCNTPTFCLLKWIKNMLSKHRDLILLLLILLFPRMCWRLVYASLSNQKRLVRHVGSGRYFM